LTQVLLTVAVAAATSLLVVLYVYALGARRRALAAERELDRQTNRECLQPLRFQLAEAYARLAEIVYRVEADGGVCEPLLRVDHPEEVSTRDAAWFAGSGCYLVSTAYLTAGLFTQLKRVREEFPRLRLGAADGDRLAELILRVHRGFLAQGGVFYAVQPSIGEDMWIRHAGRLRTYREFSELLRDKESRPWFDGLLTFYLETGRGEKPHRARQLLAAMDELAEFTDRCATTGGVRLASPDRGRSGNG
jgi:hypothetical protein